MRTIKMFFVAMALLVSTLAFGQRNINVTGTVTDSSNGEPVPFAAIQLKGTMTGASADAHGKYSISVPADGTIVFSSMGYLAQEIAVGGKAVLNCALAPDAETLDDVIVVAFGTSTKESFTGSAAVVGSDKLANSQVTSVTNALAGAVAGVQLTSSNGAPGSTSTIRVRGFSSISAGKNPLIILDGAPYAGDMANINSSDIESLTVLKDAASNALYGARGANGVIMITTKGSKKTGEAQITFDAKTGVNTRALRQYKVIDNPAWYYETHYNALNNYAIDKLKLSANEAYLWANANLTDPSGSGSLGYNVYSVPAGQTLIGSNGKLNPNATLGNKVTTKDGETFLMLPDDWSKEGYRTGKRQEYNVSVNGSTDKSNFYAAVSYLDNEGITYNSDFSRLTGRLKADYQAKKWLKVGGNFSYTKFDSNSLSDNGDSNSTGNVWAFTSQIAPIYPLYVRNGDGTLYTDANGLHPMDYGAGNNGGLSRSLLGDANAIMDNILNTRNDEGNAMSASGFADFFILDGLKFTLNASMDLDETRHTTVLNPYYGQFKSTGGTIEKSHSRFYEYNLQQILNYNKLFGKHNVGLMLGHEYYNKTDAYLYASKSKMFSQDNKELGGAAVDGQGAYSYTEMYNNEGFFGRAQYDYDSRIFASASLRRDASSRFHPDYRWGTFWSLGAAWIMSKENWFNVPAFNELKIKSSIGSQGNDNLPNEFLYTDVYDIINSDGSIATAFSRKGSKEITWETNLNFNAGAEFVLWNRLSGSIEYYRRNTTDMLFSFPVASSMGYSSYWDNVGNMYNTGAELDLNLNLINADKVQWDVNFNTTFQRTRISKLDEQKKTITAFDKNGKAYEGYQDGSFFIAEGTSLYSWYLRDFAGVDAQTGESMWFKTEKDEDGNFIGRTTTTTLAEADYYVANKTTIPDFYGGFGTSLALYGFDFSINFSYQIGGSAYDSTYAMFMGSPYGTEVGGNYHQDVLKSWTKDKPSKTIPRFQFGDEYSAAMSTRFLTTANYLNIENVNFGYTLPNKITKKFGADALRIYVAGENLWYWSNRRGFDPRQTFSDTADASNYSPMRTISGGITLKF